MGTKGIRNTKKQQAYNAVYDAIDKVREYRGLPVNRELFIDCYGECKTNDTTAKLEAKANAIMQKIGEPIPMATEKQMALLIKFSTHEENAELAGVENWKINKYQASELIAVYIMVNQLINNAHVSSYWMLEEEEKKISAIIEKIVK